MAVHSAGVADAQRPLDFPAKSHRLLPAARPALQFFPSAKNGIARGLVVDMAAGFRLVLPHASLLHEQRQYGRGLCAGGADICAARARRKKIRLVVAFLARSEEHTSELQ